MVVRPFSGPLGKSKAKAASSGNGVKGSLFSPGGTAKQLWSRDPDKRKVDASGLLSPEDTLIAIARGMHPGVLRDMEDRATIRGGLTALRLAGVPGYTKVPVNVLKSTLANLPEDDDKLRRYAKRGNNLRESAAAIRKVVQRQGLEQAAWGARQLYVLDNIKGFSVGRGIAAAAVGAASFATLGVGAIISAGLAVQGAISGAIAKKVAEDATNNLKQGLAKAKSKRAGTDSRGASSLSAGVPRLALSRSTAQRRAQAAGMATGPAAKQGISPLKPKSFSAKQGISPLKPKPEATPEAAVESEVSAPASPLVGGVSQAWLIGGALAVVVVGGALWLRSSRSSGSSSRSGNKGNE